MVTIGTSNDSIGIILAKESCILSSLVAIEIAIELAILPLAAAYTSLSINSYAAPRPLSADQGGHN
jgi:hypothetical protein